MYFRSPCRKKKGGGVNFKIRSLRKKTTSSVLFMLWFYLTIEQLEKHIIVKFFIIMFISNILLFVKGYVTFQNIVLDFK